MNKIELSTKFGKYDFYTSMPFHQSKSCDSFLNVQEIDSGVLIRFSVNGGPTDGGVKLDVADMAKLIAVLSARIANMKTEGLGQ